jgi:glyoxylase-like metal-dependent hydrolase (beta-lactamase superfamily II)
MERMSTQGTPGRPRQPVETAARQAVTPVEPCCVFPSHGKASTTDLFELKTVADGVYAAIAAPQYKINSNAAVILTNDGAIVVDSHSKPSAARALFREIQGITTQPVHTLINTHFHWDHWQGNEVYAAASANLEIISSARTQENLLTPGAGVGGVPYIAPQLAALPTEIAQLKDEIRRASNPELKARLETNLQQAEAYFAELQQLTPALPTRTVASSVTLHEHGRELQLLLLGRAHTDGDIFIYLPQEKVIVTGDAVVDWMPFLGDGYPEEWIDTLNALEQVDFTHMIPGHGDVMTKEHIAFFRNYLTDLIAAVKHAAAAGASLADMQHGVAEQLAPAYEGSMSKYPLGQYRDRIGTNIEAVYQKVVKKG